MTHRRSIDWHADRLVVNADRPVVNADRLVVNADRLVVNADRPVVNADRPVVHADRLIEVVDADRPIDRQSIDVGLDCAFQNTGHSMIQPYRSCLSLVYLNYFWVLSIGFFSRTPACM